MWCEFCNIEEDGKELLMESDLHTDLSGKRQGCGVMATGVRKDHDGYYSLYSEYVTEDGKAVAEHGVHLDFCPWCGRELKHMPKLDLGK